ncbi:allergen Tha p 1-like [Venturia canescens]|uniref:allergen Tha p 1-like n=1 Tax=Venturia canescens TaxID=32260 RepID=UPI001C9C8134|nr:allergen Tha p 1-like [Venturia canescens]
MSGSLILFLALAIPYIVTADVELYSDKYDDIDAIAILNDDVQREQYYGCFMDTAPCLSEGAAYFKGNLPEVLVTKCAKCTVKQQQMFDDIVDWYTKNDEAKWNALVAKNLEDAKRMKVAAGRK